MYHNNASARSGSNSSSISASKRMKLQCSPSSKHNEKQPVIGHFLDSTDDDDDDSSDAASVDFQDISSPTPKNAAVATNPAAAASTSPAGSTTSSPSTNNSTTIQVPMECPGSSVKQLKGWLSDFEKKQKEHYERNGATNTARIGTTNTHTTLTPCKMQQSAPTPASTPAQQQSARDQPSLLSAAAKSAEKLLARASHQAIKSRGVNASISHSTPFKSSAKKTLSPGPAFGAATAVPTPSKIRFASNTLQPGATPRTKQDDVQATNDGYASVSKLSKWLENDPTKKKPAGMSLAHRRGPAVSQKSRAYSPIPANDATRTVEFRKNGVKEGKQWLEKAFKKESDEEEVLHKDPENMSVAEKAKWLQSAFAKKEAEKAAAAKAKRRDHVGRANVAYAAVGPVQELTSWSYDESDQHTVTSAGTSHATANERHEDASVATATSASSSFALGKQMLESRTEQNSIRGKSVEHSGDEDRDIKASVKSKRAAFERKEEDSRAKGTAKATGSAVKAHWEVDQSSHLYTKTLVQDDDRKCTAVKKLSDLP